MAADEIHEGGIPPFPPERPADDARPETQKDQEAAAAEAALAGEHGTDGPPQQVDPAKPAADQKADTADQKADSK